MMPAISGRGAGGPLLTPLLVVLVWRWLVGGVLSGRGKG